MPGAGQEASRIGLGTYHYAGGNGFGPLSLFALLQAAGFAGADLPGATAVKNYAAWSGALGTDGSIVTGFDLYVTQGTVYFENNANANAADAPVDATGPLRIRDYTMDQLKKLSFFCPVGTPFDVRIQLVG